MTDPQICITRLFLLMAMSKTFCCFLAIVVQLVALNTNNLAAYDKPFFPHFLRFLAEI